MRSSDDERFAELVGSHAAMPRIHQRWSHAVRSRARAIRWRGLSVAVAVGLVAVTVVGAGLVGGRDADPTAPADPPTPGRKPHVAVWYDRDGLHHGDRVYKIPAELAQELTGVYGVLAVVRGGAVYLDPAKGDVWFHPWDGRPHIIGHSVTGPGGDSRSDVAAWFEGDELVVYDTAHAEEISRTTEKPIVIHAESEHAKDANGFLHVSAEEVVWRFEKGRSRGRNGDGVYRLDLATGTSTVIAKYPEDPFLEDVHDDLRVLMARTEDGGDGITVETSDGPALELPGLESPGRLSSDGSFMLSSWWAGARASWWAGPRAHGVAIIDVRSGERWNVLLEETESYYGWVSWSYDNVALIGVDYVPGEPSLLLACDAAAHSCERLAFRGKSVLPAS